MSTPPSQHSAIHCLCRDRHAVTPIVQWRRDVPDAIRVLGALANANYADVVTAAADEAPGATPEQLIQAGLDGVPRGLLLFIPFVQRFFLGLQLKLRPSSDHLLGWKIVDRGENWMRIESASWFLTAHVVMHIDQEQMSFASFIRYERWPAMFIWPPVSLIHRQVALALVRSAIRAK
jgi:hypothetical protein